mgnify:FL=1
METTAGVEPTVVKCDDSFYILFCEMLEQLIQMNIVTMKIMQMDDVWFNFIYPAEKVFRWYMRVVGLFPMYTRKERMKFVVESIANDVPSFCLSHLRIRTGNIAFYAWLFT